MILFVETSGKLGGLLLADPTLQKIFQTQWTDQVSHSETITHEFEKIISQASIEPKDLQKIILDVGPGSFTGLRVAFGFALSLSYLLQIPILEFNSLELASLQSSAEQILVSFPAIKGNHYVAAYERKNGELIEIVPPQSATDDELQNFSTQFRSHVSTSLNAHWPKVEDMLTFYRQKPRVFQEKSWNLVHPLYLRRSQAEENLSRGLLKPLYDESESEVEHSNKEEGGGS
ncbi:MAG TPA: tRNA (adenosine(37)-N6)-threonylcarbamoyltransferase complex dimerization subunit type 1 TsaB [Bdellovibrionales bacterium]|nr:tRNA (adenosine(37)-N6)-threonylcarbamoyltransferase complex dimerization subunit type 1 TsaB [Bdellovibrionales bacterium]